MSHRQLTSHFSKDVGFGLDTLTERQVGETVGDCLPSIMLMVSNRQSEFATIHLQRFRSDKHPVNDFLPGLHGILIVVQRNHHWR